ncbi:TraB/GumN family protein [Papillibacter cinnamivorans]|uniref:TraB family protein n=1 Tax=Papillibacter cinnamivorans DSM 12816 TaxID=1122930 RepID=A0A1W2A8G4_9FIRM|nr:TraB/GumN family protein [Papillibacter cinnamivorans]SMC56762.1 hypothetical protein SAMN02745168_1598 [Papillibacter cinnamivorans DSM 12816]
MRIKWKRGLITGVLALTMLLAPALQPAVLAVEGESQAPDSWAVSELVDAEALNLLPSEDLSTIKSALNPEQEEYILDVARQSLSLLGYAAGGGERAVPVNRDQTRGSFAALLYNELAALDVPEQLYGDAASPMEYMVNSGIIRGYGNGDLGENNPCTLQEALLISRRFITNLYEESGKGSLGLLWKAQNGGNTLYLLGTIHVDRGNIYPFSQDLMDAILSAQTAVFEVDFLDQEGLAYFAQKQRYTDGTTLKDHIPEDLYNKIVASMAVLGYTEEQTASIKAWALANLFSTLSLQEEDSPMVMDSYVYSKALVEGKEIGELEGYAYQADLFDSLSEEYQQAYLAANYYSYILSQGVEETQGAETVDQWLGYWKQRDAEDFAAAYAEATRGAENDELYMLLYGDRNQKMTDKAAGYLRTEGENTFIIVAGAGHMIGETGIVNGLRSQGFQVELVPAA